ncbi:MAG: hypothetical protein JWQ88_2932 [Rhodoferax sp.]|nr:hypothetical protein [Rhodoferax sp.]
MAGAVVLLALAGLVWWFPSEEALAQRAGEMASEKLGVPVTVGTLHWNLLPAPRVVLGQVRTGQPMPIIIDRLQADLRMAPLWRGKVELLLLDIDGATVPQLSLRGLGSANAQPASAHLGMIELPLARLQVRDLHWISRSGGALTYEGEADFDPGWRPRQLQLRRAGATTPAELSLVRQNNEDQWLAEIRIGNGTAAGEVTLQIGAEGSVGVRGQFDPKNVDVAKALDAFERRSPVSGKASGHMQLTADGEKFGDIARSLHTRTTFSMAPATLLRFDLDRAIKTLGKEHAGSTRLDKLTGVMDTQNTADGIVTRFTDLKASSGALTATGEVKLAQQRIDATAAVDLVDGVIGVPVRITGPLSAMQVSVPPGALAGAAVGTAVLPGIGTAIGARIGATIEKLFGRDPPAKPAKPAKPAQ